ncbi:MAG TPA: protein-disulfide reductase DsbD domain-containing protein, partial [Luteolibacter sp.]
MHRSFLILITFLYIGFAEAQFELPARETASVARIISEEQAIAPGKPFTVALQLEHPAGWHSYYQHSGGVETPPAIQWMMPEGFSAGPIQWPVPEVKDGYFGKSFVYSGSPVFLVDITAPARLEIGKTVTLTAHATWQICETNCLDEKATITLTLPVAAVDVRDAAQTGLFEMARKSLPLKIPSLTTTAQSDGGDIQLRIEPASAVAGTPADFIPNQPFLNPASAGGTIRRDGDAWLIQLKRKKLDALEIP